MLTVTNAVILTMNPAEVGPVEGWMTVGSDGRVAGIGTGHAPNHEAAEHLDAGGAFIAPGFVSSHSHLSTSGSRGMGTDQSLYAWVDAMTAVTRLASPEDMYWLTLHGALDFLANGITTAYDFSSGRLNFNAESPGCGGYRGTLKPVEHVTAQLTAKLDAGLRFVNSVMLDDTVGTPTEVLDRLEGVLAFADPHRQRPEYLGDAVSGAAQWAADPSCATIEVDAMHRFGLLNQPHFLETHEQKELQQTKFAWYRDAGAFGPDLVFGHFVQTTPAIIRDAAAAGCAMSWQPTSNGRLASGVADIPAMRAAGMRIGVGLDDQSCTDCADPWMNMRMGIYTLRATTHDPASMPVAEMLELHTLGSARVLGVDDHVGSLEVGKYADFLVVDPRRPDTGPVWDAYGTYVLACGLRNLRAVFVGGRQVATADGVVTHPEGQRASQEVHRRLGALSGLGPRPAP